jgi:hypothetical protein
LHDSGQTNTYHVPIEGVVVASVVGIDISVEISGGSDIETKKTYRWKGPPEEDSYWLRIMQTRYALPETPISVSLDSRKVDATHSVSGRR